MQLTPTVQSGSIRSVESIQTSLAPGTVSIRRPARNPEDSTRTKTLAFTWRMPMWRMMRTSILSTLRAIAILGIAGVIFAGAAPAQTPMQAYGVWHCYTDGCNWFSTPNMATFDADNHWLIDRGDAVPAVNVVV